jgi:hypothetical protein
MFILFIDVQSLLKILLDTSSHSTAQSLDLLDVLRLHQLPNVDLNLFMLTSPGSSISTNSS